jgi:hypothetical protein
MELRGVSTAFATCTPARSITSYPTHSHGKYHTQLVSPQAATMPKVSRLYAIRRNACQFLARSFGGGISVDPLSAGWHPLPVFPVRLPLRGVARYRGGRGCCKWKRLPCTNDYTATCARILPCRRRAEKTDRDQKEASGAGGSSLFEQTVTSRQPGTSGE